MPLHTQDFLNLRLASRSMVSIFSSTAFWKSWFQVNAERGFLNYHFRDSLEKKANERIDWRLLYHSTCKIQYCQSFDLTKYVWEVSRWLKDAMMQKAAGEDGSLEFAGRALQSYHNTCWAGTHIETVDVPSSLTKVGVSVARGNNGRTIFTGIEFISQDRSSVILGRKNPGTEVMSVEEVRVGQGVSWEYPGAQAMMDAKSFRGFSACRGPGGYPIPWIA